MQNHVLAAAARRSLLALILSAGTASCDTDSEAGTAAQAAAAPLRCDQLTLADSSAQPLDAVGVRGVPDGYDGLLYAEVRTPGDGLTGYAPVEHTDGEWVLRAPIHPSGAPEGGSVEVLFTDGELRCSPVSFTIEALPEAPGTFAAVVDALDEVVRLQAGRFGVAPQALRAADPDTLASYLLPLLVARRAIDHPQGLRAWAEGTAPVLDTLPEGRDLLNRLLAQIGLTDALDAYASDLRRGGQSPASAPGATLRSGYLPPGEAGSLFHFAAYPLHLPRSALRGVSSPNAPEPDLLSCTSITTAEVLDFCMGEAAGAAFGQTHASGKVLGDLGLVAGLVGFINPAVGAAAGFVTWVTQTATEGVANLLPSSFVSLEVEIGPTAFEEDYPFNRNPPGPGEWKARVTATSKGWTLDKLVFEAALQALAGKGLYDAYLKRLTPDAAGLAVDMWNYILGNVTQEAINSATGLPGSTGTALTIDPEKYGPIDISDEEWSDQRLVTGQAIEWIDHGKYVPHMVDGALVEIRTKDGRFGGKQIRSDHVAVDVRQINVILSPDHAFVDAGDTVVFRARVEDALDTGLEVEATAGTASTTDLGDGEYAITFIAPLDKEAFDVILTARSTSTLGLRGRLDAPPRVDIATIELNRLEVLPATACVEPGDTLRLAAHRPGDNSTGGGAFRWSASAGSITGIGTFRAPPSGAGTVTIDVVDRDNPELRGDAELRYGSDCNAAWTAVVAGGPFAGTHRGPHARGIFMDGKLVAVRLSSAADAAPTLNVSINATERRPFALGAPSLLTSPHGVGLLFAPKGTVSDAVNEGTAVGYGSGGGSDLRFPPGVTAEFRMLSDTVIAGMARGVVYRTDTQTPEVSPVTVQIEFRAKAVRQ